MTYSVATMQGGRAYQEDRVYTHDFSDTIMRGSLLAVMDGHFGFEAADICAARIPEIFSLKKPGCAKRSLHTLCRKLAEETKHCYSGTTLSTVCILEHEDVAHFATIGDSPVVAIDASGHVWHSESHNVRVNMKERAAAVRRGGFYSSSGYMYADLQGAGVQCTRVLGDWSLSRILSRKPSVFTVQSPRVILLATDGLVDPAHEDDSLVEGLVTKLRSGADAHALLGWRITQGPVDDNATAIVWRHKPCSYTIDN
ncbi:MAG: PP2C family serine/threonine-protein phosphatase [Patescibacteria group bacterium]